MPKYDYFFSDEAFRLERGEILEIEDTAVCACNNSDLLYCSVHKKHFAIVGGVRVETERKGFKIL